jgi:hypothetical protein
MDAPTPEGETALVVDAGHHRSRWRASVVLGATLVVVSTALGGSLLGPRLGGVVNGGAVAPGAPAAIAPKADAVGVHDEVDGDKVDGATYQAPVGHVSAVNETAPPTVTTAVLPKVAHTERPRSATPPVTNTAASATGTLRGAPTSASKASAATRTAPGPGAPTARRSSGEPDLGY